jgi:hypothetical protein
MESGPWRTGIKKPDRHLRMKRRSQVGIHWIPCGIPRAGAIHYRGGMGRRPNLFSRIYSGNPELGPLAAARPQASHQIGATGQL